MKLIKRKGQHGICEETILELLSVLVKNGLMPVIKTIWIEEGMYGYRVSCYRCETCEAYDLGDAIEAIYHEFIRSKHEVKKT